LPQARSTQRAERVCRHLLSLAHSLSSPLQQNYHQKVSASSTPTISQERSEIKAKMAAAALSQGALEYVSIFIFFFTSSCLLAC
jgi:hypothetical protein